MKRIIIAIMCMLMLICLTSCKKEEIVKEETTVREEVEQVEEEIPVSFSNIELLNDIERWGVEPGLGIRTLHELGYTGKGVNVAYCDQPLKEPFNEEIKDCVVSYINNTDSNDSMHGNAVASLLCGKNIGTAPEINLYFYSYASWEDGQQAHWVECLEEIIEQNKSLPKGQKIRMVGFSNNIREDEPYAKEIINEVKKCNDNDIMVLWCGENSSISFKEYSDKDNPENAIKGIGDNSYLTAVPADSRTTLIEDSKYNYWGKDGGLSWTMPYTLGVYAIAQSIDYDISQDEIQTLVKQSNYTNASGIRVFQPVEFIAKVLEKNNRQNDADVLRETYKKNFKYKYVLYNSSKINNDDINAIDLYLNTINDSYPILIDCKNYRSAKETYKALQEDHKERGGKILGIQILGNSDAVFPFEISYEAKMTGGVDSAGTFYSDYFYQNLDNNIDVIDKNYSIYKHFEDNIDIDLTPNYPLARLPLAQGEYTNFFNKYNDFVNITDLDKLDIANFSNPIFASENHIDDFGIFLNRLHDELHVIDKHYELYGNTLGQYPVKNEIMGPFNKDSLSKVNEEKRAEIIINSHGQRDNIDLCYFENNKEVRQSVLNMNDINSVLDNNYYYLDLWICNNGFGMKDNLTTKALNGKAVGVFSANHIISNNGVNNMSSVTDMKKANFYYFYYTYLRTLNSGFRRSTAFFKAQYKYYKSLDNLKQYDADRLEGNYQFNFNNLLDYENYGVLNNDDLTHLYLDDVYQDGEEVEIHVNITKIEEVNIEELDDKYEITMEVTTSKGYQICIFDPPNGDTYKKFLDTRTIDGDNIITFTIDKDTYNKCDSIMVNIFKNDNDTCFYQIK